MKKNLLLAGAMFLSLFGFAQSNTTFGLKAGALSSTFKGDAVNSLQNLLNYTNGAVSTSSLTGFYAGGYASIPMGDMLSIEPGIYFSRKGYQLNGELGLKGLEFIGANAKAQLQSNYIDVPVLLKASFDKIDVFAGPQVAYLVNANLKTTAGILGVNLLNKNIDATDQFNRWDAAVTAGLGYNFSKNLGVAASYDYGLSKIDKNKSVNSNIQAFKVGLTLKF